MSSNLTFLEKTGCGQSTTTGLCSCGKTVKVPLQSGKNLFYNGPNLAGTGVRACDSLNSLIQKMDTVILELRKEIVDLKKNR
jgi:hypothetical protein